MSPRALPTVLVVDDKKNMRSLMTKVPCHGAAVLVGSPRNLFGFESGDETETVCPCRVVLGEKVGQGQIGHAWAVSFLEAGLFRNL